MWKKAARVRNPTRERQRASARPGFVGECAMGFGARRDVARPWFFGVGLDGQVEA